MWWSALRLEDFGTSANLAPKKEDVEALVKELLTAAKSQHAATPFPWPPQAQARERSNGGAAGAAIDARDVSKYRHMRSDLARSQESLLLLIW